MNKLIYLDPGHGFETPGKRSPDGTLREYEFNGDVAERAKCCLENQGFRVVITRPTTKDAPDVPLTTRTNAANQAKADLFISIHANAYGQGDWNDANGYEVYVLRAGLKVEELAKHLLDCADELLGVAMRGVKYADFHVLRESNMDAVLIEHAFMTNRSDCEKLKDDRFRELCAQHIATAVCRYYGVTYSSPSIQQGPFSDVPADHWAASSVAWAKEKGVMSGFTDGTFKGDEPVTRYQLAAVLQRFEQSN